MIFAFILNSLRFSGYWAMVLFVALFALSPARLFAAPASGAAIIEPLFGRLDRDYLDQFDKLVAKGVAISISSTGGRAEVALDIADRLREKKDIKLSIEGVCLSACAEIILPSAAKYSALSFKGLPIIGFHQNSEIFRVALLDSSKPAFEYCTNKLNQRFMRFVQEVGRSMKSFKLQAVAVAAVPKSGIVSANCLSSSVKLERRYWFPTSQQLKSVFAIDVPGRVCADVPNCIQKVLSVIGKDGDKYLVGETEFLVTRKNDGLLTVNQSRKISLHELKKE
jgi:hypothetical protein